LSSSGLLKMIGAIAVGALLQQARILTGSAEAPPIPEATTAAVPSKAANFRIDISSPIGSFEA
jgi:hypothetical protein